MQRQDCANHHMLECTKKMLSQVFGPYKTNKKRQKQFFSFQGRGGGMCYQQSATPKTHYSMQELAPETRAPNFIPTEQKTGKLVYSPDQIVLHAALDSSEKTHMKRFFKTHVL